MAGVIPPMYGHTMVYHASSHSLYIVASCGFYALRLNTKTWQTLQTHHHQVQGLVVIPVLYLVTSSGIDMCGEVTIY